MKVKDLIRSFISAKGDELQKGYASRQLKVIKPEVFRVGPLVVTSFSKQNAWYYTPSFK